MPTRDFFTQQAKTRTAEAIRHVESMTNAELVVAVRRQSGRYDDPDLLRLAQAISNGSRLALDTPR